jgi:hypothetical protein
MIVFSNLQYMDSSGASWKPLSGGVTIKRGMVCVQGNVVPGWTANPTNFRQWAITNLGPPKQEYLGSVQPSQPLTPNAGFDFLHQFFNLNPPTGLFGAVAYEYDFYFVAYDQNFNQSDPTIIPVQVAAAGAPMPEPKSPGSREATASAVQAATSNTTPDCNPAQSGFHLSFPHDDALACYSDKDGLLTFGHTDHCVRLTAALFQKGSAPYPGKVIQMKPPWWIIQFPQTTTLLNGTTIKAPIGAVTLVLVDQTLCPHEATKPAPLPKLVKFIVTGACTW